MTAEKVNRWMKLGGIVLILEWGVGRPAYGFAGGTGEPRDPYQIATAADLVALGADNTLWDKHFVLINDIDLDPNLPGGRVFDNAVIAPEFDPKLYGIGGPSFAGVFDGQGHSVRHLRIEASYGYAAGLFGSLAGVVKNLHLEDVRVHGAPCGALAGHSSGATILRCSVTGRMTGSDYLGGLVGAASQTTFAGCESRVDVVGDANSIAGGLVGFGEGLPQVLECCTVGTVIGGTLAGGLIGGSEDTTILRCAARCQVRADVVAGGLLGEGGRWEMTVLDSYARGSVCGLAGGGLLGSLDNVGTYGCRILNCYAACEMAELLAGRQSLISSGFVGRRPTMSSSPALVLECFWDKDLPQVPLTAYIYPANYGTALTTQRMQQAQTFQQAGWDLSHTWTVPAGDYPVLQWELAAPPESKPGA